MEQRRGEWTPSLHVDKTQNPVNYKYEYNEIEIEKYRSETCDKRGDLHKKTIGLMLDAVQFYAHAPAPPAKIWWNFIVTNLVSHVLVSYLLKEFLLLQVNPCSRSLKCN